MDARRASGHDEPTRVLFVCVENCNRSQMAEAFARLHGAGQIEAYSAGCRPAATVHLKAIAAMDELGYDLRTHRPKGLSDLPNVTFDLAVTMDQAAQQVVLNCKRREDWDVPCPKTMSAERFRGVRNLIRDNVLDLLARISPAPDGNSLSASVSSS